MYRSDDGNLGLRWVTRRFRRRLGAAVSPTVWYLGVTSLLTDVSSEMVASVLPLYLVFHLQLSPLAFGTVDGLYHGVTSVTRWMSGFLGDRWRRHKEVAVAGYAISAASRLGLMAAGSSSIGIAAAISADRLGKGIRTAPRDALISLSTPADRLGQAFGVHRTLDAAGALLGPVVAFLLLALVADGFDVVFVTSLAIAVVGAAVITLFVANPPAANGTAVPNVTLSSAIALVGDPGLRPVLLTTAGLSLVTISDAFVYVLLQERHQFPSAWFPLLYAATAFSYLCLATPIGIAADRIGRTRVFVLGHAVLAVLYVSLLAPVSRPEVAFLSVVLLGVYYAATDGVVAALASGRLPAALRGSGLALVTTATSIARLTASIGFGYLWTIWGRDGAVLAFAAGITVATLLAAATVGRHNWTAHG